MKKIYLTIFMFMFFFNVYGQEKISNLTVILKNLKVEGTVYLTVYNNENGFPMDSEKSFAKNMKKVANGTEKIVFNKLPFGTYAISVWHDQNDNGKMEKSLIGIPKEGLGVSNNAKGKMGPPKFKDAKFQIDKNEIEIEIQVKY